MATIFKASVKNYLKTSYFYMNNCILYLQLNDRVQDDCSDKSDGYYLLCLSNEKKKVISTTATALYSYISYICNCMIDPNFGDLDINSGAIDGNL